MLSVEEQAAVDAERDALRRAMPNMSTMTFGELEQWHADARRHDAERIARREATVEQIQQENDLFTSEQYRRMVITNFERNWSGGFRALG